MGRRRSWRSLGGVWAEPLSGQPSLARRRSVVLIAAAAVGVSQSFGRFTYSLLFTDIRDDLAISNTVGGAIGSANLLAYLAGTAVLSAIVGRVGLGRAMRAGLLGVTAALIVMASSSNLISFGLASTTAGFFGSFVWITAPGVAIAEFGPERRGLVVGVLGGGIGFGLITASLLARVGEGWQAVYQIEAVVAVVVTTAVIAGLRNSPTPAPGGQRGLQAIREVPGWQELLAAYCLFGLAISLVMTFAVAVLQTDAGWSRTDAGTAFALLGLGTVLGGPVFGPLSDRFGRAPTLVASFVLIVAAGVFLPLGWKPWTYIIATTFGMAFTGVPTTITARVGDYLQGERFGAAFGIATMAFGVGLVVGPQLGGALADATGSFRPAFGVVAGAGVVGAIVAWRQPS